MNKSDSDPKKVASFSGELTAESHTVMTCKKVAGFFQKKIGSAVPGEGPTFFSEQGPA